MAPRRPKTGPSWVGDLPGSGSDAVKRSLQRSRDGILVDAMSGGDLAPIGNRAPRIGIEDLAKELATYERFLQSNKSMGDWRPELRLWMRKASGAVMKNFREGGTEYGKWDAVKRPSDRDNPKSRTFAVPALTDWGDARIDPHRTANNKYVGKKSILNRETIEALTRHRAMGGVERALAAREKFIQDSINEENERRAKISRTRQQKGKGAGKNFSADGAGGLENKSARDMVKQARGEGYLATAEAQGFLAFHEDGSLRLARVPQYLARSQAEQKASVSSKLSNAAKSVRDAEKRLSEAQKPKRGKPSPADIREASEMLATARTSHERTKQQTAASLALIESRTAKAREDWAKRKSEFDTQKRAKSEKAKQAREKLRKPPAPANALSRKNVTDDIVSGGKHVTIRKRNKFLRDMRLHEEAITNARKSEHEARNPRKQTRREQIKPSKGGTHKSLRGLREAATNVRPGHLASSVARLAWQSAEFGVNPAVLQYAKYHGTARDGRYFNHLPYRLSEWTLELVGMGMMARLRGEKDYRAIQSGGPDYEE